jgi:hypothetical protein
MARKVIYVAKARIDCKIVRGPALRCDVIYGEKGIYRGNVIYADDGVGWVERQRNPSFVLHVQPDGRIPLNPSDASLARRSTNTEPKAEYTSSPC